MPPWREGPAVDTKSSRRHGGRSRRRAAGGSGDRPTRVAGAVAGVIASVVERLEDRRLLSADLAPAFVGDLPPTLPPAGKNQVTVRVGNVGDAKAVGAVTVRVYASTDATLDAGDVPL